MPKINCISLWQPWAWAMTHGKDVENRPLGWLEPPLVYQLKKMVGKRIYIHAGKKFDHDGYLWMQKNINHLPGVGKGLPGPTFFTDKDRPATKRRRAMMRPNECRSPGIVAVGTLVGVMEKNPPGPFHKSTGYHYWVPGEKLIPKISNSPWFSGPVGLVIPDCKEVPFFKCPGRQGIFNVDVPDNWTGLQ